jgi:hypothetical protein
MRFVFFGCFWSHIWGVGERIEAQSVVVGAGRSDSLHLKSFRNWLGHKSPLDISFFLRRPKALTRFNSAH